MMRVKALLGSENDEKRVVFRLTLISPIRQNLCGRDIGLINVSSLCFANAYARSKNIHTHTIECARLPFRTQGQSWL